MNIPSASRYQSSYRWVASANSKALRSPETNSTLIADAPKDKGATQYAPPLSADSPFQLFHRPPHPAGRQPGAPEGAATDRAPSWTAPANEDYAAASVLTPSRRTATAATPLPAAAVAEPMG